MCIVKDELWLPGTDGCGIMDWPSGQLADTSCHQGIKLKTKIYFREIATRLFSFSLLKVDKTHLFLDFAVCSLS